MPYFLHNKYDKNSINMLKSINTSTTTVIDYYTRLQNGDMSYQYVDTSNMPCTVNSLTFVPVDVDNLLYAEKNPDTNMNFSFETSINIKSVQRGVVNLNGTGSPVSENVGNTSVKCYTIDIVPINPERVSVTIQGFYNGSNNYLPIIAGVSPNKLKIGSNTNGILSYEIVEFK